MESALERGAVKMDRWLTPLPPHRLWEHRFRIKALDFGVKMVAPDLPAKKYTRKDDTRYFV